MITAASLTGRSAPSVGLSSVQPMARSLGPVLGALLVACALAVWPAAAQPPGKSVMPWFCLERCLANASQIEYDVKEVSRIAGQRVAVVQSVGLIRAGARVSCSWCRTWSCSRKRRLRCLIWAKTAVYSVTI